MVKICLDAGHGGNDSGAIGHGLQEKDVALDIVKRIDEKLKQYEGVQTLLTRSSDIFVELAERAAIANRWGADYFLSAHLNAFNGQANGYEDFIHISASAQSISHQNTMHAEITKQVPEINNRGRKTANFAVLRLTRMPAILTENGFIDNARDAALLKRPDFLDRIAHGHVEGIIKIYGLQRKVVPSMSQSGPFPDVPKGHWAEKAIEHVKKEGIMQGKTDGTFAPNEPMTRAQMAQVIFNMNK
ncbi:N-acetylmuramoyl-L-alanine amidase [Bacillus sp. FJAT-45350]|uniref:N-acetylmuramoyl-L-alanine amidase n=1 Tax=Bacillus sp. FJAT-45350 TaxID=2011014 RepID=UPI000BB8DC31|nr:N-acetylmuramoyl-L-alanine amidase [Bacillus sp. FJAT-45350]